jgi:hypothetical protein
VRLASARAGDSFGYTVTTISPAGCPSWIADRVGGLDQRILSARRALLRHPWASRVLESRATPTPVVLADMDSMIGMLRAGGFSLDLTHHALHAMGSRMFGFTQELFNDPTEADPQAEAAMWEAVALG